MNNLIRYIILFALIWFCLPSLAQKNPILGVQTTKMQAGQLINPAHLMKSGADELSFVPFANFHVDVYLPYSMKQVFSSVATSKVLGFQNVLGVKRREKTFFMASSFDWFSLSGSYRDAVWRFAVEENFMLAAGFNHNFIELIHYGNSRFVGEEFLLDLSAGEVHVRSLNFTWAQAINDRITLGLTGKIYSGRSWFNAKTDISLYTDELLNYIDLGVDGKGKVSVPITLRQITGSNGVNVNILNYLFGVRNPGVGFDLGATYSLSPQIEISASITDFGFILWNRNTTTFEAEGDYRWNGIDMSGRFNLEELGALRESNTMVSFRDTFLNRLIEPDDSPFLTFSPASLNAGATWLYTDQLGFGVYVHSLFFSHYVRINLGLTNSLRLGNRFELISGLAFSNLSLFNIPAAVVYNGRMLNASVSVSNLLGVLAPASAKNFGGSINIAYRVGREKPVKVIIPKAYPFYQKKS